MTCLKRLAFRCSSGAALLATLFLAACQCSSRAPAAGRLAAGTTVRCDGDAGPCAPRPILATSLDGVILRGLTVDLSGEVLVTGLLRPGLREFDGMSVGTAGACDLFAARFEPASGRPRWVRRFGHPTEQEPTGAAVTADGTMVIVGHFIGPLVADGVKLASTGFPRGNFLLGLGAADGKARWGHVFDEGADGTLEAIASHPALNRVAVCGWAGPPGSSLAPGEASGGGRDAVVAVFDSSGRKLWSQLLKGPENQECDAVAMDATGDVYVAGRYNGSFSVTDSPLPTPGSPNRHWIWVAKLDGRSGAPLAQAGFGSGPGVQRPYGLAVDDSGRLAIAGSMTNTLPFGRSIEPLTSAGAVDAFVALLDSRSSPPFAARWAVRLGSRSIDEARNVIFEPTGDVLVTGLFTGHANGAAELVAEWPGTDAFLLELDGSTGVTRGASSFGDAETQTGNKLGVGSAPSGPSFVVLGGEYAGTLDFKVGAPLRSNGASFLLFAR